MPSLISADYFVELAQSTIKPWRDKFLKVFMAYDENGDIGKQCSDACLLREWKKVRKLLSCPGFAKLQASHQQDVLNQVLWQACHADNMATVDFVLTSSHIPLHADIHAKDKNGYNAFLWACDNGNRKIIKRLWSTLDDENIKQSWIDEAFADACTKNHEKLYQRLLEGNLTDTRPDLYSGHKSVLVRAHFSGNSDLVNYLAGFYPEFKCLYPYDKKVGHRIYSSLQEAVNNDSLSDVKYLLKTVNFQCASLETQQREINNLLMFACLAGNMKIVQYLLDNKELSKFPIPRAQINCTRDYVNSNPESPLINACKTGSIALVKYLLTRQEERADIHAHNDEALVSALQHKQWEMVKYLLSAPEITAAGGSHANIHAFDDTCLVSACFSGQMDLVRFLCESPDIPHGKHANIHAQKGKALRMAFQAKHHDVVNYLVFEQNMQLNPEIKELLKGELEPLLRIFENRALKASLQEHLPHKTATAKRSYKI